jgi:hypothetical protein
MNRQFFVDSNSGDNAYLTDAMTGDQFILTRTDDLMSRDAFIWEFRPGFIVPITDGPHGSAERACMVSRGQRPTKR